MVLNYPTRESEVKSKDSGHLGTVQDLCTEPVRTAMTDGMRGYLLQKIISCFCAAAAHDGRDGVAVSS